MGIIIRKSDTSDAPEFEDGTYPAKFLGLSFTPKMFPESDGQYGHDTGDRYRFAFVLKTDDGPLEVDGLTRNLSTHEKANSYMYLHNLLTPAEWATLTEGAGAEFDADDINGRSCQVTIEHRKNGWPNITAVLKAKKSKAAPVVVADDEDE